MSGCIKHEDKEEKQKKQLYNWNFMEQKKTSYVVSSAEHKDQRKSLQQSQFINVFQNYSYVMTVNGFLLVSWKLTSFPLYAFFSLFVMTRKAMICCRMKVSGLVMSTSTSGLLIWLVKPSFIISGKYLYSRMKD